MADISQISPVEVLVPFTRGYRQKLYAGEIARQLNEPLRTVARKLAYLSKLRLISYTLRGKNKYYYINQNNYFTLPVLTILENYRELRFLINYPQEAQLLSELSVERSLILFGSYAKGLAKPNSDLDLVIFGKKNKRIKDILDKYDFEVNAHYIDFVLFEKRLREKQALANEIVKDHILFGPKDKIISLFRLYSGL